MNIPPEVVKAADDAYWRDGRVLDEYTVIAEWARAEALKEAAERAISPSLSGILHDASTGRDIALAIRALAGGDNG